MHDAGRSGGRDLLVPLHAAPAAGATVVGTKAATLGLLARAGLAVPEGLVLTTRAARLVVSEAGLGPDASPEEVSGAGLPGPVEESITAIAAHFGDATLAVRSSDVDEDLAEASYAGQYETVLGVCGLEDLRAAVRRCWASAYTQRVRAYSRARAAGGVAVLVQRQVDADVSGVAFTANPTTGDTDEVLVSAVRGLGDDLVSGRQTPDEWVVRGSTPTAQRAAHGALAEPQVRAVAALAKQAEELLGQPQDIEWAMAGGRLVILQSRPVTALPVQPAYEFPPGTWFKDVEHYAEPFTAFGGAICAEMVSKGLTSMFESFGGLLERMDVRVVGGEVYLRPVPMGGRDGPPPPWWLLGILARVAPPLRERMRAARRMVRPDVFATLKHDWETVERPRLREDAAALRAVDLGAMDLAQLGAHLEAATALLRRGLYLHFQLIPLYSVTLHELVQHCSGLLGWTEPEALALVAGTSVASSAPAKAFSELATKVASVPGGRDALAGDATELAGRLAKLDPTLGDAFNEWCEEYAYRCVHDDPGSPMWMEQPWLLATLLGDLVDAVGHSDTRLGSNVATARQEATDRALAALSGKSAAERARFERALSDAATYYPLREDSAFWGASIPAGAVRLALLEVGRRLHANGLLDRPGDVVYLDPATISAILSGHPPAGVRATAKKYQAERAWTKQHPGPPVRGPAPAGAPPDLRALPEPGRQLNRALLWGQPRPAAGGEPRHERMLTGAAASPGAHTGPARIIRTERDFPLIRPGDVLVCATTDPAWSVLFGIAGALVTDHGGLLAHAAIVAREHGIPAVVGTGHATSAITDGELITVHGSNGRVTWRPVTTRPHKR